MKTSLMSKNVEKQVAKLLLSDGKVLVQARNEETNEPMFQVSQHIIKDKTSSNFGQTLYGLFGYHKGKCLLMSTGLTKELILNEFLQFVPLDIKI